MDFSVDFCNCFLVESRLMQGKKFTLEALLKGKKSRSVKCEKSLHDSILIPALVYECETLVFTVTDR